MKTKTDKKRLNEMFRQYQENPHSSRNREFKDWLVEFELNYPADFSMLDEESLYEIFLVD